MRREICWSERLEDRVKREVRVSFHGRNAIRWQSKRSDQENWEYDFEPSREDWESLLDLAERWYKRKRIPVEVLELIRSLARTALG